MVPLLVHLVFHPQSAGARKQAECLHRALNEDPAVPGLRIPTRFTPEDGTYLPPVGSHYFNQAERVFVLVLADDSLNAEYDKALPFGRHDWGPWIGELFEACSQNPNRRFVPFQLSKSAWPLDPKLKRVSFARICDVELEKQEEWIKQRLLIELIRFLKNSSPASEKPQETTVKAFISYATRDLQEEPEVVKNLIRSLKGDQPVSPWLDAGQIGPGDNFEEAIKEGISSSALLIALTDTYSSREWCKKEILLVTTQAKSAEF
jgi:TIR domain